MSLMGLEFRATPSLCMPPTIIAREHSWSGVTCVANTVPPPGLDESLAAMLSAITHIEYESAESAVV